MIVVICQQAFRGIGFTQAHFYFGKLIDSRKREEMHCVFPQKDLRRSADKLNNRILSKICLPMKVLLD